MFLTVAMNLLNTINHIEQYRIRKEEIFEVFSGASGHFEGFCTVGVLRFGLLNFWSFAFSVF